MNALLLKERRSLRPAFLATIALTILTGLVCTGSDAASIVIVAFTIGVTLMAASSFGNEFHTRTMMLLLTQPIPRERIWREKMRELAIKLTISYLILISVLFLVLSSKGQTHEFLAVMAGVAFIPLCVFCSTPCFTLSTKTVFAAIAATVGLPWGLTMIAMAIDWLISYLLHHPKLFLETLGDDHPAAFWTLASVAGLVYCAFFYHVGRVNFMIFQVVDSQIAEIGLPAPVERAIAPWATKILPGFTGHVASLVRKELHLHRVSFIIAGLTVIVVPPAWLLWRTHPSEFVEVILNTLTILPLALCAVGVPFLTSIVTVAEERNLGLLAWQMTQPVSALKQWSIKISVAFVTCVLLGIIVPGALMIVGQLLSGTFKSYWAVVHSDGVFLFALGYVAWFSVLVYASSISSNSIRAMIAGLGLATAISAVPAALDYFFKVEMTEDRAGVLLLFLTVLLNRLAYANFRAVEISTRRVWWQIGSIIVVTLLSLILFLYFAP